VSDEITIRVLHSEDAQALRELRLEALRLHPTAFGADPAEVEARPMSWWQDFAARNDGRGYHVVVVAVDRNDRLVGMTGVDAMERPKDRHRGYVWGVYVRPEARGQRLGDRLIAAAIDWARAKGLLLLQIDVTVGNEPARRRYQQAGFVDCGVQPMVIQVDGVFYDEHVMALRL
jgi:RimJ/RimL family protein N-acetyltransferase